MSTADAWLLECGGSLTIAVGDHEMAELLPPAKSHAVAGTPAHCSRVLLWHDDIVPVMDVAALHGGGPAERDESYYCLLHYQEAPNAPLRQVAIEVDSAPARIQVDDAQLCEFPRDCDSSLLKPVTLSCFTHGAKSVLIVDIAGLCSVDFRDRVQVVSTPA